VGIFSAGVIEGSFLSQPTKEISPISNTKISIALDDMICPVHSLSFISLDAIIYIIHIIANI